jgi:23S rRNA (uracil-5-)-methyltransferase RumA
MLRGGEALTLACVRLDEHGAGVAELEGWRVHVAGALPGERVTAQVAHVSPHPRADGRDAWADLRELLEPSPKRVSPPCSSWKACGSCPLAHLEYSAQLDWKRDVVASALARHAPKLAAPTVSACVASPTRSNYRDNAKYVYGRDDAGRLVLGGYAPRSHEIVDMTACPMIEPALIEARSALLPLLQARGVVPFDEIRRTGLLRYAIMRSNAAGRVLVTLVTGRPEWPGAGELAAALAAACQAVSGVVHNVNPTQGNALFGDRERLLHGSPEIEDEIGGVRMRLGSRSFFQANRLVAGRAYRDLVAAARPLAPFRRAIDAYAGAGGIALSVAPLAEEVVAIEAVAAATATARAFLAEAGASDARARVRFVTGDAAEHMAKIENADLVILNPPRKGCAPAVLQAVIALAPRFVAYLSCNPGTLARDLAVLAGAGLHLRAVTPYDMLPHTPHVEALALLEPT